MKKHLILFLTSLVSTATLATPGHQKVIYGDDNRVDAVDSENTLFLKLAESTAAMIAEHKIEDYNGVESLIAGRTLAEGGVCETERFANQPAAANCSGFLVGKNLLVTAGHCITSQSDCENNSWVFDYKTDREDQSEVIVDKTDVYKCKKIVSRELNNSTENDYALIELDREVTDRAPLEYRKSGKPMIGDEIVVIGHPSGLPTKIADGATIREVGSVYFVANLDTYGGNSGSAVFNATTGVIEGILVRGDRDYVWDSSQNCRVSNTLADDEGRGEDVTLISMVEGLSFDDGQTSEPTDPADPTQPTDPTDPSDDDEEESWFERLLRAIFGW